MNKVKWCMLAIVVALFIIALVNTCLPTHNNYITERITVDEDATYWDYAETYCPHDMDIRKYVDILEEENNHKTLMAHGSIIIAIYNE